MTDIINRLHVPDFTDDEQTNLDEMWARLLEHQPGNALRTLYYDSKNIIRNIGNIVPPPYYAQAAVLGWTGTAVDSLGRRTTFEQAVLGKNKLAKVGYDDFAEDLGLPGLIRSSAIGSLVHGVSFLINDPEMTDEDETSYGTWGDAMSTTGIWDGTRRNTLRAALSVNEWHEGAERVPASFSYYERNLVLDVELGEDGIYYIANELEHEYGMPVEALPYKAFLRPWGHSRITPPMMQLQDRAVSGLIRLEAHMDIYAIPDLWLLGADSSIFSDAGGAQKAAWQVMMGRIKAMPDDEELLEAGGELAKMARPTIQSIPASAPDPHLAQINALAKLFCREASLPDNALAITDVSNPTSADSYIESREALIAEAEGAIDDWNLPVKRFIARGLAIQMGDPGLMTGDLRKMENQWRSPVFLSRAAAADAGSKQLASGPAWLKETKVGLELLGLSPQQVRRAMDEKADALKAVKAATPEPAAPAEQPVPLNATPAVPTLAPNGPATPLA